MVSVAGKCRASAWCFGGDAVAQLHGNGGVTVPGGVQEWWRCVTEGHGQLVWWGWDRVGLGHLNDFSNLNDSMLVKPFSTLKDQLQSRHFCEHACLGSPWLHALHGHGELFPFLEKFFLCRALGMMRVLWSDPIMSYVMALRLLLTTDKLPHSTHGGTEGCRSDIQSAQPNLEKTPCIAGESWALLGLCSNIFVHIASMS